jgi:hypothetical protein
MSAPNDHIFPLLDALLDGELKGDAAGDAAAAAANHLRECGVCSQELERRRVIRGRLRDAVRGDVATAELQAAIRRSILQPGAPAKSPGAWRVILPIAAALMLCLGASIAYQFGYLRLTQASQDSYITSISDRIPPMLRIGLGDHVKCAVFKAYPNQHPTFEQMAHDLGQYKELVPIVQAKMEPGYRVETAHQCHYRGRNFVHVTMRKGTALVSLVVSRQAEAEWFDKDQLMPMLTESGIPIYQAAAQRFEVSGFETQGYLVYVVSNLGERDNMRMMAALAPSVREFLKSVTS